MKTTAVALIFSLVGPAVAGEAVTVEQAAADQPLVLAFDRIDAADRLTQRWLAHAAFMAVRTELPILLAMAGRDLAATAVDVARTCLRHESFEESHAFLESRIRSLLPDNL